MKKLLGSLLLFSLAFSASFNVHIDKKSCFVKEPIYLELSYIDKEYPNIVWVKFHPKKSDSYEVHLLKKSSLKESYRHSFLLFPLKSGQIDIEFLLQVKKATTSAKITDILGTGYEQTKIIEGDITTFDVKPLKIEVKKSPKATLYGHYTLSLTLDKMKAADYEPIYATLSINGVGYPIEQLPLFKTSPSIKILKDKPQKKITFTKKGAKSSLTINYALLSDKNFTIEPIQIINFNYKNLQTLSTKPYHITIENQKLIDSKTSPPAIKPSSFEILRYLNLIIIFLAGVLTGGLLLIYLKRRYKELFTILFANEEELLKYLSLHYPKRFDRIKEKLSQAVLKKEKIDLKKLKKEVIDAISKDKE